jgi:hypothetical protein
MVRIIINVSREKALEHKMFNYPTKRLRFIKRNGTPLKRKVATRILSWEYRGKKFIKTGR